MLDWCRFIRMIIKNWYHNSFSWKNSTILLYIQFSWYVHTFILIFSFTKSNFGRIDTLNCMCVHYCSNVITSTVTVSTQLPSTHSWKESTPTNQSGLGLMRAIMLIRVWLPSKKARVMLVPSPWGIGGPVNECRLFGESPSVSKPSALPVSTYNLAPVDNLSPNLYRV